MQGESFIREVHQLARERSDNWLPQPDNWAGNTVVYDYCAYSAVSVIHVSSIKCEALETVLQYLEEQPEVSISTMGLLHGLLIKTTPRRAKALIQTKISGDIKS